MVAQYQLDGSTYNAMPASIKKAQAVQPVYEEFPGWQEDIREIRAFEDLPVNARDYVKKIEDITEVEASIISVGQDREETLLLKNPFEK